MRGLLLLSLFAVAVPVRDNPAAKDKETIQEQILGEWELVKCAAHGEDVKDRLGWKFVFLPKELRIYQAGKRKPDDICTYAINAEKTPPTIDLNESDKGNNKMHGIIKIEGDQLAVCAVEVDEEPRPTEFRSLKDSYIILAYFKRVKK